MAICRARSPSSAICRRTCGRPGGLGSRGRRRVPPRSPPAAALRPMLWRRWRGPPLEPDFRMIRVVVFLAVIGLLAVGAVWLADRPGEVAITWQGYRVDTSVAI